MANETPLFAHPDDHLIARYDVAGPRYTSYPSAARFLTGFDESAYRDEAQAQSSRSASLSLYVHIPFCAHICLYCACTKIVTNNRAHAERYLHYLEREIILHAPIFRERQVDQVHWGGGTPTYLSMKQMRHLMMLLSRYFALRADDRGEYSIEIDPRTVDRKAIFDLRGLGFNRISLGVQDFDHRVQKAVNRIQSADQTLGAVAAARDSGFHSINMDLIYGLPYQSEQSFMVTLDRVIDAAPDRLSVFNYAHLPDLFKTQRLIDPDTLPSPEEKLRILHSAIACLTEAGYIYVGMDHFAKANDELALAQRNGLLWRNFQGYSTHAGSDLVGIGLSAISQVGTCYIQNAKTLETYYAALDDGRLPIVRGIGLTEDDILRRDVIMQLTCHMRLDTGAIDHRYGISFQRYFQDELTALLPMEQDGLVKILEHEILVTALGRLLVRNICMIFDRYLRTDSVRRYSRTV